MDDQGTNADSSTNASVQASADNSVLLDSIERLLDKKLKPIESKLCLLEQKQNLLCNDQEKVMPMLHKVQKLVDNLVDQEEKASRKIKDEVYNVQDTLETMNETIGDIKAYTRDNMDSIENALDKVTKVHKHLKVQDLIQQKGEKPPPSSLSLDKILPDLNEIKQALVVKNLSTLDNDIKDINDKINQMETMKDILEKADKNYESINTNLDQINSQVQDMKHQMESHILKFNRLESKLEPQAATPNAANAFSNEAIAADFKMHLEKLVTATDNNLHHQLLEPLIKHSEETIVNLLAKKVVEIKKCILEETNDIQKILFDQQDKSLTPDSSSSLCTKIDVYNEGMRNLISANTKKVTDLIQGLNNDSKQKENNEYLLCCIKQHLGKMHHDGSKELVQSIKNVEIQLKQMAAKSEKFHGEQKNLLKNSNKSAKTNDKLEEVLKNQIDNSVKIFLEKMDGIEKQMTDLHSEGSELLNDINVGLIKVFDEKLDANCKNLLRDHAKELATNQRCVIQQMCNRFEQVEKCIDQLKVSIIKSDVEINEDNEKRCEKIIEAVEQFTPLYSEIKNSCDEIKIVVKSPRSNTDHEDILKKMEEILGGHQNTSLGHVMHVKKDLLDHYVKGIEVMKTKDQENLEKILKKFDVVEHRFAVIRKYVKTLPEVLKMTAANAVDQVPLETSNDVQGLKIHMTSQCKILGDSIANALDKFLPNLDNVQIKKNLEGILPLLTDLKECQKDPAKGSVIEDQLQALATTILEPIEELKPIIQDNILQEVSTLAKIPLEQSIETLNLNQAMILKELRKNEESKSIPWVMKVVDSLKKIQAAQNEIMTNASLVQDLQTILQGIQPKLDCYISSTSSAPLNVEFRQKIDVISDLLTQMDQTDSRTDIKQLIKDIRDYVERMVKEEFKVELSAPHRRKGQKRKESSENVKKIRRSRKKVKYNESEEDEEEDN